MKKIIVLLFPLFAYCNEIIDLNNYYSQFVLNEKQIKLFDYPGSLNPSIVPWGNQYLLSFRIRDKKTLNANKVGLIILDKNFNIITKPQVLNIKDNIKEKITIQDPRLIILNKNLYMIYSHYVLKKVFIAELTNENGQFRICNTWPINKFPHKRKGKMEKNWVPFIHNSRLLLSYSINPHVIYQPNLKEKQCNCLHSTFKKTDWKWGELRGGTPALLVNENEYLAFFHSSKYIRSVQSNGKNISHYFFGAYVFSAQSPFELKKISSTPIVGKKFYSKARYKTWRPLLVVFPCGYVIDNDLIHVVYGKQDNELWVATLDKKQLLSSLRAVISKDE